MAFYTLIKDPQLRTPKKHRASLQMCCPHYPFQRLNKALIAMYPALPVIVKKMSGNPSLCPLIQNSRSKS